VAEPVRVMADGEEVDVAADGSFRVAPGATVLVRSGGLCTRLRGAGGPPLADNRLEQ
jgi:hypothetical protein